MSVTKQQIEDAKNWCRDRAKSAAMFDNGQRQVTAALDTLSVIRELEAEVARLDKLAYLRIPIPRIFRRKER